MIIIANIISVHAATRRDLRSKMSVAALVLGHTGSVRGLKGGVQKLLTELREKNERLEESPVVQRLREVSNSFTFLLRLYSML